MRLLHILIVCGGIVATACAATTIDPAHPHAYGANLGWMDAQGDVAHGAVLGQSFCTGSIWSANAGWIDLGQGPTNGWHYNNTAADDWGINHDGLGHLSGYAYGANIGWIVFEQTNGQPQIDLWTGNLSGSAWGANVGWISLSNLQAFVRTESLEPGLDTDSDGIPDPWEYRMAGSLSILSGAGHDQDKDGVTDVDEYPADTDPLIIASLLTITDYAVASDTNQVTWSVQPSRFYLLEETFSPTNQAIWTDTGEGLMAPDPGASMTREVMDSGETTQFYRTQAVIPLSP